MVLFRLDKVSRPNLEDKITTGWCRAGSKGSPQLSSMA